ncbi:hypothetical protein SDRG_09539 [Saprolegnia diclina VS20]|uniref:Chromatin-remodeling ATPase INO80 n=1 Tax=Saprolegnia diclina (strain VS20) TaxID=1156394 RepID=T0Q5B6_SAPDV|nr:hypothetical protein SDRG_09539 [Saprolegnia diclina VS20]EQC33019.1 hypothetical protein SDRG_09539 [Saprolegnia diclina VS20]|eukprot:XP_008613705.1 hypothetical protein SDRG_09539 [Saprolegnia diclina VS20]
MKDDVRRLLCVDHLPLLMHQLAAPSSRAHVAIPAATRDDNTLPTNGLLQHGLYRKHTLDQRSRGKLELEACYVGTELRTTMPNKGALVGNVYDEVPDESDELVYDALEKAYNAAFTMSSTEKLERERKIHVCMNDTSFVHAKPAAPSHVTSPFDTIDTWRDALLEGRKRAIFAVTKRQALCDIDAYKAVLQAQHDETLQKLQTRTLEGSAQDLWTSAVVGESSALSLAASALHERRLHRQRTLRDLAASCLEAQGKLRSRSAKRANGSLTSHDDNDSALSSSPDQRRAAKDKPVMISRQRDILGDNVKMTHFLLAEATFYTQMLLGQRPPQGMTASEHFSSTALGLEEIARVAEITASTLYKEHACQVGEFDAEWQRWRQRISDEDRIQAMLPRHFELATVPSPTTVVSVPNPFQDASKWAWLDDDASSPVLSDDDNASKSVQRMKTLYAQGVNGMVVSASPPVHEVLALLTQLGQRENKWGPHLIVTSCETLALWESTIEAKEGTDLRLLPYWGSDDDRATLRSFWADDRIRAKTGPFHVVLTTYRVLAADMAHWHELQWQLVVYDRPRTLLPELLHVRCRQRWLLAVPDVSVDARLLLHFVLPELFDSKQKTLAWGTSGFDASAIDQLLRVLQQVVVAVGCDDAPALANVVRCTTAACDVERAALIKMDATPVTEYVLSTPLLRTERRHLARFKKQRKVHRFAIEAKKRLLKRSHLPSASASAFDMPVPSTGPKKRNRSSGSRAKKRVTRCGKCPGCLAGDCMECGHCQDMKKYGGPGLRKQSCKNRKCTNPQVMTGSSSTAASAATANLDDEDEDGAALALKADDDGHFSESQGSSESDQSKLDDDMDDSMDDSMEEGDLDDAPLSKTAAKSLKSKRRSKLASLNNRSRVMRCGVCVGCLSPDCMKCRHCQDMKKYGGPGLRKQSCKSRKCVTPKVVVLNQGMDEDGELLYLGDDAWPPVKSSVAVTPMWARETLLDLGSGLGVAYLLQRQLDRFLKVPCMNCEARFATPALKQLHHQVVHAKKTASVPRWQRELAVAAVAPSLQYSLVASEATRTKPLDFEPAGYAKLVGPGLCYYMLQTDITLGRLSSKWRDRYESLGINFARGLAGGSIDCHLGDDLMISAKHARIKWDVERQQFTIQCLSFLTSISVNGRDLTLASAPLGLRSRNLIQIGAFYFFFLLPMGNHAATSSLPPGPPAEAASRQVLPRAEVLAWLDAKRKRALESGENAAVKRARYN